MNERKNIYRGKKMKNGMKKNEEWSEGRIEGNKESNERNKK